MKKLLLLAVLLISGSGAYCQMNIFMKIIENKMICNKEDQFTYFLQSNSYERKNENNYMHYYTERGEPYYVDIINENECYATYRTNNVKDYNQIKSAISTACPKEYSKDKAVSYICNSRRVQDVQIIFVGYSKENDSYDIEIFKNPHSHELPYRQSDRMAAGYDR
jgi:hypothetical protein